MGLKFKEFVQTRKVVKGKCSRFKTYISKGFYYLSCEGKYLLFNKISLFKALLHPKRSYYINGDGTLDAFSIVSGTEKINFITSDLVVSRFLNSDIPFDLITKRIEKYLPQLDLPHSDYLRLDNEKKEMIIKHISGETFSDSIHIKTLMNVLVKKALSSKVEKYEDNDGFVFFSVQHGDAYGDNVIWQGDDNFVLIDNENVGLYPAFYDALLLASIHSENVAQFLDFNDNYLPVYKRFCEKYQISFSGFFDKYLSYFIYFRMMSYPLNNRNVNHRPFIWMKDKEFEKSFPKASLVLSVLSNGEHIPEMESLFKECWQ